MIYVMIVWRRRTLLLFWKQIFLIITFHLPHILTLSSFVILFISTVCRLYLCIQFDHCFELLQRKALCKYSLLLCIQEVTRIDIFTRITLQGSSFPVCSYKPVNRGERLFIHKRSFIHLCKYLKSGGGAFNINICFFNNPFTMETMHETSVKI